MSQGRDDLVIDIEGMFPRRDQHTESKPKIFLVVNHPHQANENDYVPKKVSIGPIHHRNDGVKSMEQHKVRFLQELLRERDDLSLEMVEEVRKMEGDARRCYAEYLGLENITFLKMLLLDGCFIIQLIRRYFSGRSNNDPIFRSQMLIQITHDLLLFENQLPFFVLNALFNKIKTHDSDDHLHHLILYFVSEIVPWLGRSKAQFPFDSEHDHLLGLVYSYMSTKIPHNHRLHSSATRYNYNPLVIHTNSASELMDFGGIVIKMSEDNRLTFSGKVLSVPPLHVYPETESLLWNLMAYEQLQLDDRHQRHVTDYMYFLHCLTRSIKDVEILQHSRIVRNYIGGDEKILQMFDRLGTNYMGSFMDTYSYIFKSLNMHCSNQFNRYMASLMRNYFNTLTSVISVLAATFLLLLTVAQTVLAVLSFTEQKP